jgi:hypothetical protein
VEVVVVCNGCTDATADVARSFRAIQVIELPVGSKPAALRAGDRAVTALPRVYLDADVVLGLDTVQLLLKRLGGGTDGTAGDRPTPPAARPPVHYDATGSSWLVRRYYRARSRIPAVLGSLWGAGVYALSADGRSRFDEFPDLVADDLWVDQLFPPGVVEILDCPPVTVRAPLVTRDLLKIMRRTYRGKAEHHAKQPDTAYETSGRTARDVRRLARSGFAGLVDATVYTGLVIAARVLHRFAPARGWERDESSRTR